MKLFKGLKISFMLLLLAGPFISTAQYKFQIDPFFSYFRDLSRYEIGGTYLMASGAFNGVSTVYGYNRYYVGDTTIKRSINANPGFGGDIGIAVPFAATGHISLFAVSIHAMVTQYSYNDINKTYTVDNSFVKNNVSLNSSTMQISLPIGLDWKVGCDAIGSKRLLFGADFGAGVQPNFNMTSLTPTGGIPTYYNFGFIPYAKVEGSFFMGMDIKVRAMYSMGNVQLMDSKVAVAGYNDGPFRITNASNLMLSVLIQPFSSRWKESAWYNDYDSYNWNEHLN